MKIAIINCFETYEERVDLIYKFFVSKGNDVNVIQSNFKHFQKIKRVEEKEGFIFIDSIPYHKNISISRIKSHYKFSKDAFKIVESIKPDLIYVLLPPNSLAKFATKYKYKNKHVKLIYDIIDLWPETMPIGNMMFLYPFIYWKNIRDNNMKHADFIITECDLYQDKLKHALESCKTDTLYLAKPQGKIEMMPIINNDEINLCYLGSINNIIDIDKIRAIVGEINNIKPTTLHIIGDGESKEILIENVKSTGVAVKYHGEIYDSKEKQEIFNRCHFGLNIMKDSVCVGLTMKSIDYLQYGLPIINNIKADTSRLVDNYEIGINIIDNNIELVSNIIAHKSTEEILQMRVNAHKAFVDIFSHEAFNKKIDQIIGDI